MVDATLETYIETARNRGLSDEAIRAKFIGMGWSAGEIEAAMISMAQSYGAPSTAPTSTSRQTGRASAPFAKRSPRTVFLGVAIVIAAFILGALAYAFFMKAW